MSQKELDTWFRNLDSFELAEIVPSQYEKAMESADPAVNINTFVREMRADWKRMTKEQKEELHKFVEGE